MLRTIIWVAWVFAYFIARLPDYWRAKKLARQGKTEEHQRLVYDRVDTWAKLLLKKLSLPVTVEGKENLPAAGETVVFASNHQSYLDIPVVLGHLDSPHPLLAKRELGKIPFLGAWMRQLGCVFVEREDARAAMGALRQCEELIEAGNSVIIFPEGTRSKGDKIGEFKGGAMRIALKSGVKIVPVAINGTGRSFEGNHGHLRKGRIRLQILPAIETKGLSRQRQKELPQRLEEIVRTAMEKPWDAAYVSGKH